VFDDNDARCKHEDMKLFIVFFKEKPFMGKLGLTIITCEPIENYPRGKCK